MIRKTFLLVVIAASLFHNSAAQDEVPLNLDKSVLKSLDSELLKFGDQKSITSKPVKLDVGYGEVNSILLKVPPTKNGSPKIFRFVSLVHNDKFFYPIYIKLNGDFELIEQVKDKINLKDGGFRRFEHTTDISVGEDTRYILITTDSSLLSKDFYHIFSTSYYTPIYSGSTIINVPSSSMVAYMNIMLSNEPKIKVTAPGPNNKIPLKREKGVYFGMGMSFGGERVADNPSGDDYRAGGGAMMSLGYSHILFSSHFVARYGVGFRYQGSKDGDARNKGFFTEAVTTYQTTHVNMGLGAQLDFANSIRNLEGEEFKFQNKIGPKFILEYRIKSKGNIGLEYVLMNYNIDKDNYKANRLHLTLKFFVTN